MSDDARIIADRFTRLADEMDRENPKRGGFREVMPHSHHLRDAASLLIKQEEEIAVLKRWLDILRKVGLQVMAEHQGRPHEVQEPWVAFANASIATQALLDGDNAEFMAASHALSCSLPAQALGDTP